MGSVERFALAALATLALACEAPRPVMLVDLRTDLQAGAEYDEIVVELSQLPLPPGGIDEGAVVARRDAAMGDDYLSRPGRVAEIADRPPGSYEVRVSLLVHDGAAETRVIARRVLVDFRENLIVTVLITRSCVGVECPREGDDLTHTECLGGECVDPTCSPETPEACPPACTSDADCPERVLACETPQCIDGACYGTPTCADDEYCHASGECEPIVCMMTPDVDGGMPECGLPGEVCVDGACVGPCTGLEEGASCGDEGETCMAGRCVGPCTDQPNGTACGTGSMMCFEGACVGPCVGQPNGTRCGTTTRTAWSPTHCGNFGGTCDETGSQTRTVTEHVCMSDACTTRRSTERRSCTRSVPNGTRCGGTWLRCCNGTCRDLRTNRYCGSCGVDCTTAGLSCGRTPTGGYACRTCSTNAQCANLLAGGATCYQSFCQCQCSTSNRVCSGAGCGPSFFCHDCPGANYCAPFGGGCP